jgi:hypothetical protein
MNPAYVFHFPAADGGPIGCAALAQLLRERLPEAPRAVGPPHDGPALWAEIAKLQWAFQSDAKIDDTEVRRRLASLDLRAQRAAATWLFDQYTARYPHMLAHGREAITQIIALGNDMATAVADSADFMLYVKNEIQPVQLALYLLD